MAPDRRAASRWARLLPWIGIVAGLEVAGYAGWSWLRYAGGATLRLGHGYPDFFAYYAAGRQEMATGFAQLYDPTLQARFQEQVTGGGTALLPYINPPYVSPLWWPLAHLPFRTAYVLWVLVLAGLLTASLVVLVRTAGLRGAPGWAAGLLGAAWFPVLAMLLQGQTDALVLVGLAAATAAWTAGRQAGAGAAAVLDFVRPHVTLVVGLLFLVRSPRRALPGQVAGLAALGLSSLALVGLAGWQDYLGLVLPWAAHGHSGYSLLGQTSFSLRGLLGWMGPTGSLAAVAVLAVLLALLFARTAPRPRLDLALAVTGSLVLSPYQNVHDLTLLLAALIPLLGLLVAGAELRHRRLAWAALALCYLGGDAALVGGPTLAALGGLAMLLYLTGERLSGGGNRVEVENPASNFTLRQPDVRSADVRL